MPISKTRSPSKLERSFYYGFRGIRSLVKQRNYRIGVYITLIGFVFFLIVDRSFLPIFLGMSAVILVSESTNSAIELLCNFVHNDHHPVIGEIKDIAAAGTVVAVFIASIVGLWEFIRLWGVMRGVIFWMLSILTMFLVFRNI